VNVDDYGADAKKGSLTASDAEKIRNSTETTCPHAARVATVPKRIPIVSGMLNLSSSFLALDSDASSLTRFWANVSLSCAYIRRKQNEQQGISINEEDRGILRSIHVPTLFSSPVSYEGFQSFAAIEVPHLPGRNCPG
jgi:hypothetical protein